MDYLGNKYYYYASHQLRSFLNLYYAPLCCGEIGSKKVELLPESCGSGMCNWSQFCMVMPRWAFCSVENKRLQRIGRCERSSEGFQHSVTMCADVLFGANLNQSNTPRYGSTC